MIDHKTDPAEYHHTKAKKNDHDWSKVVLECGVADQIATEANDAGTKRKRTEVFVKAILTRYHQAKYGSTASAELPKSGIADKTHESINRLDRFIFIQIPLVGWPLNWSNVRMWTRHRSFSNRFIKPRVAPQKVSG